MSVHAEDRKSGLYNGNKNEDAEGIHVPFLPCERPRLAHRSRTFRVGRIHRRNVRRSRKIDALSDQLGPLSDFADPSSVIAAKLAPMDFSALGKSLNDGIIAADHQNKADVGGRIARSWCDAAGLDVL
jgi:hypothetical protein